MTLHITSIDEPPVGDVYWTYQAERRKYQLGVKGQRMRAYEAMRDVLHPSMAKYVEAKNAGCDAGNP